MTDGVKTFGITPDTGFNARISALENLSRSLIVRLCNLEDARDKKAFEHAIRSQAAAAQATQHLYAPLRSDTKPLLEMSAFVRKIAAIPDNDIWREGEAYAVLTDLILDAGELVKKYT